MRPCLSSMRVRSGGAMRDRTADLLRAKQALSQLSYSPTKNEMIYAVSYTHLTLPTNREV